MCVICYCSTNNGNWKKDALIAWSVILVGILHICNCSLVVVAAKHHQSTKFISNVVLFFGLCSGNLPAGVRPARRWDVPAGRRLWARAELPADRIRGHSACLPAAQQGDAQEAIQWGTFAFPPCWLFANDILWKGHKWTRKTLHVTQYAFILYISTLQNPRGAFCKGHGTVNACIKIKIQWDLNDAIFLTPTRYRTPWQKWQSPWVSNSR